METGLQQPNARGHSTSQLWQMLDHDSFLFRVRRSRGRDLTQELEDQGNTVHADKDEYGDPIYRIILADGKLYRLSAQDMYDVMDQGKLDAAGVQEHNAKILQRQTKRYSEVNCGSPPPASRSEGDGRGRRRNYDLSARSFCTGQTARKMAGSPLAPVVRSLLVGVGLAFHLTDIGLSFECHHVALVPGIELPVLCERGGAAMVRYDRLRGRSYFVGFPHR
jgi:hypothetical protein